MLGFHVGVEADGDQGGHGAGSSRGRSSGTLTQLRSVARARGERGLAEEPPAHQSPLVRQGRDAGAAEVERSVVVTLGRLPPAASPAASGRGEGHHHMVAGPQLGHARADRFTTPAPSCRSTIGNGTRLPGASHLRPVWRTPAATTFTSTSPGPGSVSDRVPARGARPRRPRRPGSARPTPGSRRAGRTGGRTGRTARPAA